MHKRFDKQPRPTPHAGKPAAPQVTHWGEVAEWYDTLVGDEGSEYHREVIIPGVLRMLGESEIKPPTRREKKENKEARQTQDILDLACGQGVLCRRLAQVGHRVVGIDAAETLIAAARKRNEADRLAIRYDMADATRLRNEAGAFAAGLAAESFDAITLVLAIQNITPLSPVWQACRGLLKPGGRLILVMMHPCFRVPRQSDWHWDDKTGTQERTIRQYLTSTTIPIQTHPGLAAHGKDEASTTHFHRPLQAYVNTLGYAGLLIDHIEEWASHKKSQPGPRQAALDKARKEVPMFLALRARRV